MNVAEILVNHGATLDPETKVELLVFSASSFYPPNKLFNFHIPLFLSWDTLLCMWPVTMAT